mmetsp:Transcript_59800/g.71847  ORF Transcript_59800/g.71847 Transcript_59800/m.71847 type:complete len:323 (+) Transcript_59800:129-1097(+)
MPSIQDKTRGQPQQSIFCNASEIVQIEQAVIDTKKFAEDVSERLASLQWKIIGFTPFPDGAPDYTKPRHSMPYPNNCISDILSNYTNVIKDQLFAVMSIIDKARLSIEQNKRGIDGISVSERFSDDSSAETFLLSNRSNCVREPDVIERGVFLPQKSNECYKTDKGGSAMRSKRNSDESSDGVLDSSFSSSTSSSSTTSKPNNVDQVGLKKEKGKCIEPNGQVHYIVARQYKSPTTAENLGCPAFNLSGEIVGFYRKLGSGRGPQFTSINYLQPLCRLAVKSELRGMLVTNLQSKKMGLYCLKNWGYCLDIMVEEALEYAYI